MEFDTAKQHGLIVPLSLVISIPEQSQHETRKKMATFDFPHRPGQLRERRSRGEQASPKLTLGVAHATGATAGQVIPVIQQIRKFADKRDLRVITSDCAQDCGSAATGTSDVKDLGHKLINSRGPNLTKVIAQGFLQ